MQWPHKPDSHPELPVDPDVLQPRAVKRPPHLTAELQALVFAGGCLGALARYGVTLALPAKTNTWPAATFAVNLTGAFLLGLLMEGLARAGNDRGVRRLIRLSVGTGFLGAFTTYSTFAIETNLLARRGDTATAAAYIATSVIGGLVACTLGIQLASIGSKRKRKAL